MNNVVLKGFIIVPTSDLETVESELPNHRRLTLSEAGCVSFEVTQCKDKHNRFDVHEVFVDMAAYEFHQKRVKNSYWGKISADVERHYELVSQV